MIRELPTRLHFLFHRRPPAADLDEELRAHIERSVEANIAAGMTVEEARRKAMIDFGSLEATREQCHEQKPGAAIDILRQDLRFTLRSLRRDRGLTLIAVLILALGIGANIVVFSLVNTILLRPLEFRDPSRLVWIAPPNTAGDLSAATYSADAYDDLCAMSTSYESVTGYFAFSGPDNVKLTGIGVPRPATGIMVLGNFFQLLGVRPQLGRHFRPEETLSGAPPVVMLSHAFWKRQFHSDPNIVGKAISLDNKPVTVIGVLPASFDFGANFNPGTRVDLFKPVIPNTIRPWGNTLALIGRLKPGVTLAQARAEGALLFPRFYWQKKMAESKGAYGPPDPIFLKDHIAGQLRRSIFILWSAVALILLIVCVNLSNLMLARASARSREFALRVALGAGRGRIVRQVLTESSLLSAGGALLGLAIAYVVTAWLAHQGSIALPLLSSLRIDAAVFVWTLLVAVVACLLFGLVPGLRMAGGNLETALKEGGQGSSEGRKHDRLRTALIISEIALTCVLTVGAGLLLRSFLRVLDVDLGFQPSHAAAIPVDVDGDLKIDQRSAIYANVLHEISALPGIEEAGFSDYLPLAGNRSWGAPGIKGVTYKPNERPSTLVYVVSPGYMKAMGMSIHGRDFTWQDNMKSELVVIMNEKAARFFYPAGNAIGQMINFGGKEKDERIIGVVSDVHTTDVESNAAWQVYLPIAQDWGEAGAELVVRTTLPPSHLEHAVLGRLREINPNQPQVELRPLQQIVNHATSPRCFFSMLVSLFALIGLVLASLGIYGVISYKVTRQTQEIGIRMALGASRNRVQLDVIGRPIRVALIGIAIGTIASFIVARAISSLLFATEPGDPATFFAMLVLLLGVALIAGYLPARRASRVDPLVALRVE